MAEASRGRVTITLGSSGQVVKRNGRMSDSEFSDSRSFAGSKRSVRDRLGSDVDNSFSRGSHLNNKRRREDSYLTSFSANGADDVRIGKGDLRLKLMQRNASRQARSDDNKKVVDLREKLSRTGPSPLNCYDTQHRVPGSREASTLGRIPSTRSADNLPQLDSRGSYSPWTLDHLRRRSPDRVLGTSRGLPPPRSVRELQGRQLSRAYDEVRTAPYMGKDIRDASRPMSSTVSYAAAKPTLSAASAKPLPPGPPILSQIPPTSGIIHKSSYAGDEQQTVDGLLHSIGLGKYAILFKAEEVDMTALKQMKEHDLKELGIPMGPRKKILLALLPPSKRQS